MKRRYLVAICSVCTKNMPKVKVGRWKSYPLTKASMVAIRKSSPECRAWACMGDSNLKVGLIGFSVCQRPSRRGVYIRPLVRLRLCLRLSLMTRLRLTLLTFALTPIAQAGRAVSTSIPLILPCESLTFPQVWWQNANKNAHSTPTKTRR